MKKILIGIILFTNVVYGQTKLDSLILDKINEYRMENGLLTLVWHDGLFNAAKNHVNYMRLTNHISHDQDSVYHNVISYDIDPDFVNRIVKYTDDGMLFGENIAKITVGKELTLDSIAELTVKGWINSPLHNKLLLDNGKIRGAISSTMTKGIVRFWVPEIDDYVEFFLGDEIVMNIVFETSD